MKLFNKLILFLLIMGLQAFAKAAPAKSQILICGTINISTNTAAPGGFGAAVIETFVLTKNYKFKLQSGRFNDGSELTQLVPNEKVTVMGTIDTKIDSFGNETISPNADGSIDLQTIAIFKGCS